MFYLVNLETNQKVVKAKDKRELLNLIKHSRTGLWRIVEDQQPTTLTNQ